MANEQKKGKSRGFAALGIPNGSILVFKKDSAVTVKTLDDKNKVEYLGKPYSISTLAKQLVGSPVSGYLYFKFEGKILKSLAKSEANPAASESAGHSVSEPAEGSLEPSGVSMESREAKIEGESKKVLAPLPREIEVGAEA
jgi:hypothetical protein